MDCTHVNQYFHNRLIISLIGVNSPTRGSSTLDESTTDCGSLSSVSSELQHTKSDSERSHYTPAILKDKGMTSDFNSTQVADLE